MKKLSFTILLIFLTHFIFSQESKSGEMRGVWVATVKNIDYPTSKYADPQTHQNEIIKMLDYFQSIGINAVFFQVRPAADAFFNSSYEPWSEWLTGKQGKRPEPYWDPMEFIIYQAHKRNIEFHAWINPFRAVANIETANIAADHISKKKPEWIFTYGINKYFDPGIPEVREYTIEIIKDIVKRYDVDGIHFDDYFYPYPEKNESGGGHIPLPDKETFEKYGAGFSKIEDWRRDNMDKFVRETGIEIKKIKPKVKYGIGPSGIWRNKGFDPKGSNTKGFAHYDYLYADVLKWVNSEWIDYVVPQCYWNIGHSAADYNELVNWWSKSITSNRHLYIGQGVYMASATSDNKKWQNPQELPNQLRINRESKKVSGAVFYKASSVLQNPLGFCDSLKNDFFAQAVLTPKMEWLEEVVIAEIIGIPRDILDVKLGKSYVISWELPQEGKAVSYNVYKFEGNTAGELNKDNLYEKTKDLYISIPRKRLAIFKKDFTFIVTAVSKNGTESKPSEKVILRLKR